MKMFMFKRKYDFWKQVGISESISGETLIMLREKTSVTYAAQVSDWKTI